MDVIGDGESDGYLDDDLDALISEDFLELQQRAIQSTQQQRQQSIAQDIHSLPSTATVTLRKRTPHAAGKTSGQPQAESFISNPSSDYGDLDDEVLDAGLIDSPRNLLAGKATNNFIPGVAGVGAQPEQWRQQPFSVAQQLRGAGPRTLDYQGRPNSNPARQTRNHGESFGEEDDMLDNDMVEAAPAHRHGSELQALEAKVAEVRPTIAVIYD